DRSHAGGTALVGGCDRHALALARGGRGRAGGRDRAPGARPSGRPPHAPGDAVAPGRLLPPRLAVPPCRHAQPRVPSPRPLLARPVAGPSPLAPAGSGAQSARYLPLRAAPSPDNRGRGDRTTGPRG